MYPNYKDNIKFKIWQKNIRYLWLYHCAGQDVKYENLKNGDQLANSIALNQSPLTSTYPGLQTSTYRESMH